MDKFYVGDIPLNFNYAVFSDNYIDLYDRNYISPNSSVNYYRVYLYDNSFFYDELTRTTGNYNGYNVGATQIQTTDDIWCRRDIDSILISVLTISVFSLFLINLVTSIIKKGGLLGGLL